MYLYRELSNIVFHTLSAEPLCIEYTTPNAHSFVTEAAVRAKDQRLRRAAEWISGDVTRFKETVSPKTIIVYVDLQNTIQSYTKDFEKEWLVPWKW